MMCLSVVTNVLSWYLTVIVRETVELYVCVYMCACIVGVGTGYRGTLCTFRSIYCEPKTSLKSVSLSVFIFLAVLCGTWDLVTSDQEIEPMWPAVEAWSLNHWTAREVLKSII